jgi:hypothetical protein
MTESSTGSQGQDSPRHISSAAIISDFYDRNHRSEMERSMIPFAWDLVLEHALNARTEATDCIVTLGNERKRSRFAASHRRRTVPVYIKES